MYIFLFLLLSIFLCIISLFYTGLHLTGSSISIIIIVVVFYVQI